MPAADAAASAVTDAELAALFSLFPPDGRVILAVSGGADSTALLLLAERWRAVRAAGPALVAATVDHGLRPEAQAEAQAVAALAARLGVPHALLRWEGEKPAAGIEAAARAARHALLAAFARENGARFLATAHTLDDQAETVLMRLAAGSGPAGLAAMRARAPRQGLTVLRPFLALPKARLVATLAQAGIPWSEDPMNRDPAFARPRLRQSAAALAREGLTPARLARLAGRLARWDAALQACAERAAGRLRLADGSGRFDGRALAAAPEELALRVLAAEIGRHGREIPPHGLRLERLEALWASLRPAILAARPLRRTLGGATVALDARGAVAVAPAAPRRRRPATAALQGPGAQPFTRSAAP